MPLRSPLLPVLALALRRIPLALAVVLAIAGGCATWKPHSHWRPGGKAPLLPLDPAGVHPVANLRAKLEFGSDHLESGRAAYARAESLARRDSPASVDAFYQAALHGAAWYSESSPGSIAGPDRTGQRGWDLYHASLARMIYEGERLHRLRGATGVVVQEGAGARVVPLVLHGFAWGPEDFQKWYVVGDYYVKLLRNEIRHEGLGVPVVIVRQRPKRAERSDRDPSEHDFLPHQMPFAATAVLRADGSAIDLYEPQQTAAAEFVGVNHRLARDLTAPIAQMLHFTPSSSISRFIQPGKAQGETGLLFLEPYQADKIPLLFIHGLLSEPRAWADVANELRACEDITRDYQVWAYKYSTGESFLRSAAILRAQLDEIARRYDPEGTNPTLHQMVIVGHSMGGLIAKLQITHSGESLWNLASKVPPEELITDETTRARLIQQFFFDPNPLAKRVVFIATPHDGSAFAARTIGRAASALVDNYNPAYEQLRRDNPHALTEFSSQGLPTSIDLLEPSDPLLKVMRRLPIAAGVSTHTILGRGIPSPTQGDSDGIVPTSSARHPGVASELELRGTHSGVLHDPQTLAELKRILRLHAANYWAGPKN